MTITFPYKSLNYHCSVYVMTSQIRVLETWGNMERDHISAISTTKDYLRYVVCMIPLVEGAKVISNALMHIHIPRVKLLL